MQNTVTDSAVARAYMFAWREHYQAKVASQHEATWAELVAYILGADDTGTIPQTPTVLADKTEAQLVAPVSLQRSRQDDERGVPDRLFGCKDENVAYINCLCFDFDRLDVESLRALTKFVTPWQHLWYFSHSCHEAATSSAGLAARKARLLLPLSQPVAAADWPDFWARAASIFAEWTPDPSCSNAARYYFLPSTTQEGAAWYMVVPRDLPGSEVSGVAWAGCNLDADAPTLDTSEVWSITPRVDSRGAGAGDAPAPGERAVGLPDTNQVIDIDVQRLRKLAKELSQKLLKDKNPERYDVGKALQLVLEAHRFAAPGARHQLVGKILGHLLRFPGVQNISREVIADLFTDSHMAMALETNTTPTPIEETLAQVDGMRALVEGQTAEFLSTVSFEKSEDREKARLVEQAYATFEATGVHDAAYKYSAEDLQEIAGRMGVPVDRLRRHWILLLGKKDAYVVAKQRLFHVERLDLKTKLMYLTPTGLTLTKRNIATGEYEYRSINDFQNDNIGVSVSKLVYDYNLPSGEHGHAGYAFDPNTSALSLGVMRSTLKPVRHPVVDKWFELLFADKLPNALDWFAQFPDTRRGLKMMVLVAPPGVGKNALTKGLASLWSSGEVIPFPEAAGKFNGRITTTPFTWADEGFGDVKNLEEVLRRIVTDDYCASEAKFQMPVEVRGYRRVVHTANSLKLDRIFAHTMEKDDNQAIRERFATFSVPSTNAPAIRRLLQSLRLRNTKAYGDEHYLSNRMVGEHILYIAASRNVAYTGDRFDSHADDLATEHELRLKSENVQLVFHLIKSLMDGSDDALVRRADKFPMKNIVGVRWGAGHVYLRSEGISTHWERLLDASLTKLTRPLKAKRLVAEVRTDEERVDLIVQGQRTAFYIVDMPLFYAFLRDATDGDIEAYRHKIETTNPNW
jgi:hypothetical protein